MSVGKAEVKDMKITTTMNAELPPDSGRIKTYAQGIRVKSVLLDAAVESKVDLRIDGEEGWIYKKVWFTATGSRHNILKFAWILKRASEV